MSEVEKDFCLECGVEIVDGGCWGYCDPCGIPVFDKLVAEKPNASGGRSMRWEILFQWNDELNDPPRAAIVSDDPLSLKDDTVMYTLDADEVANGIVGDYLDFRIVEAVEEDEA